MPGGERRRRPRPAAFACVIYDILSYMGLGRLRFLVGAAAAVGLVVAVASPVLRSSDVPEFHATGPAIDPPAGGSLPAVSADQFEGMLVGLRGQPVVVNVWASWCAPCRAEMPLLQRAADQYEGRAVVFGVASEADQRDAADFLSELGVTYPNVFDASGEIRVRLELSGFPTTYVFDATGRLRRRFTGAISEQQIAAFVEDAGVE